MGRSFNENDPFLVMTAPPPNETPEEQMVREHAEAAAKRVSEQIDEAISKEKSALKKKTHIKILLLGQSESGKSTTLKNFQLIYSPKAWTQERLVWTSVIQLNLARNVNTILDILHHEMSIKPPTPTKSDAEPLGFSEKHRLLKLRLTPIRGVQKDLERKLGSGVFEDHGDIPLPAPTASSAASVIESTIDIDIGFHGTRRDPNEFFIWSNNSWKDRFRSRSSATAQGLKQIEDVVGIIAGCKDDMKTLWTDEVVQQMLKKRKYPMEDSPGFFLNDVDRIAARDYVPSDDDIIRARLRTLGVQEHRFTFEEGRLVGTEWHIYDVGGSKTSRASWAPYFDDVDAIIFLAPLNCFDERLAEDPRINRLQDSYELWESIVSNKLLSDTQIILFLNKHDLLKKKLERGVKVKNFVQTFGARENTTGAVVHYFEHHFKEVFKKHSSSTRPLYLHVTSVIDTKATRATLSIVEDSTLREHLRRVNLL